MAARAVQPLDGYAASVAWRTEALIGLSALGVSSWEAEIVGVTRQLFHDGPGHQEVSRSLFGADYDAIHRWMDTVPGSGIRGGGIVHRLQHGHDAAGAAAVYEEHGLPGLLVWMQHISQDVMTPAGVPIPLGGQTLAAWMVDEGYATPGKAALALSFNIAELAASFLAGAFALRLASLLTEIATQRRIRRRCEAAREAWAIGDLDAAIAHYQEARSLGEGNHSISLALGWLYASLGRPAAESFLAFRSAALQLAAEDHLIDLHGTPVSLRGIAYMLALSQGSEVLSDDATRGAWRAELGRMMTGGIASFERAAIVQIERPSVRIRGVEATWRPRPLSAAANYYLAARMARSAPFLTEYAEGHRLAGHATRAMGEASRRYPREVVRLSEVRSWWRADLHYPEE